MNRFNKKKTLKLFICYKHLKIFGWIDVFNLKSFLTTGSLFPQQCLDKRNKDDERYFKSLLWSECLL